MSRTELFIECMRAVMPSRMKAKTIMWWLSLNAVAIWWYSVITKHPIDGSIAAMYGTAVAAFSGSKIAETVQQGKTTKNMEAGDV